VRLLHNNESGAKKQQPVGLVLIGRWPTRKKKITASQLGSFLHFLCLLRLSGPLRAFPLSLFVRKAAQTPFVD
jgi:hypothetical protein